MLKPIALTVAGLLVVGIAAVLVLAANKPDVFRVQRSARIKASPETIFAFLNDFRRWKTWSPYEKLDPAMKRDLSGPASGPGAVYEWDGNRNAGAGRIEIVEASPPSKLALTLAMTRPFACRNDVAFTLKGDGDATQVTWAMEGPSNFLSKVVGVFLDMDKVCGGQFDEGLANLKSAAERKEAAPETASVPAAVIR